MKRTLFFLHLMDGKYSPSAGDTVVDMGLRGLIPIVNLKKFTL